MYIYIYIYICTTATGSSVGIAPRAQTRAQHSFVGAWLLSEADIAASLAPLVFLQVHTVVVWFVIAADIGTTDTDDTTDSYCNLLGGSSVGRWNRSGTRPYSFLGADQQSTISKAPADMVVNYNRQAQAVIVASSKTLSEYNSRCRCLPKLQT
jgi:hypothetical protein